MNKHESVALGNIKLEIIDLRSMEKRSKTKSMINGEKKSVDSRYVLCHQTTSRQNAGEL